MHNGTNRELTGSAKTQSQNFYDVLYIKCKFFLKINTSLLNCT